MELVAGSYEQVLFGFCVRREPGSGGGRQKWTPVADFTHHAHTASVSAVAVNSRFVVTGSRDETIHIYDMKKKTDHGALVHHSGTITCLKFFGSRHLISGAEDGLLCVWDAKTWECLKSIRAHKGQVTFLSIHPSGKLALSVGTDKTLRTWNLVEGRSAFIKNIKQNAHIVEWSPSGEKYIVVLRNQIDVYQLDTASVSGTITNDKRISSVTFLSDSVLAVAGDEEAVRFFDCDSLVCLCEFKAHENRRGFQFHPMFVLTVAHCPVGVGSVHAVLGSAHWVKDLFSFQISEHHVLVTASNDGFIKMWKLKQDKKVPPSLLCEVNTGARLTCLGVWLDSHLPAAGPSPPSPVEIEKPNMSEEEKSQPGTKKSALTSGSTKRKESSLVSTKKRKVLGGLDEMRKKRR